MNLPRRRTLIGLLIAAGAILGALSLGPYPDHHNVVPAPSSTPSHVATPSFSPMPASTPTPTLASGSVTQLRFGDLTLGLVEGWQVVDQAKSFVRASHCLDGQVCTYLSLSPPGLDSDTLVAACLAQPRPKGIRSVGSKSARYYEGTGCGENGRFHERIWVTSGVIIVASSTAPGDQNGIDKIMKRYAAWLPSPE